MNQGDGDAAASTTRVVFSARTGPVAVDEPTPPLAIGETYEFVIEFPDAPYFCFIPNCHFEIIVDADSEVAESSEANNTDDGMCLG